MNNNSVLVERDRKVAIVTINRPEVKNAVDSATARALAEAFEAFDRDDSLNVAILTGAQGAFCAGADLREVAGGRREWAILQSSASPLFCRRLDHQGPSGRLRPTQGYVRERDGALVSSQPCL